MTVYPQGAGFGKICLVGLSPMLSPLTGMEGFWRPGPIPMVLVKVPGHTQSQGFCQIALEESFATVGSQWWNFGFFADVSEVAGNVIPKDRRSLYQGRWSGLGWVKAGASEFLGADDHSPKGRVPLMNSMILMAAATTGSWPKPRATRFRRPPAFGACVSRTPVASSLSRISAAVRAESVG